MEENEKKAPESTAQPALPARTGVSDAAAANAEKENRTRMIMLIAGVVVIVALIVLAIVFLMQPTTPTGQIRDVFIIFMALETLIIGVALVILIIQLATLINLLQHEIKPILDSTNETVNTLRGTATFISDNVSEPIIKLNEYMAALKKFFEIAKPKKR